MLPKLHYYNPGHETVLLQDSAHYTPPANVQRMQQELALLPVWYAEDGDYVFVEENTSPDFLSLLPPEIRPKAIVLSRKDILEKGASLPHMVAAPWGISLQSLHLYTTLRDTCGLNIDVPEWKEAYKILTGRKAAADCFMEIRKRLPEIDLPPAPLFFSEPADIESWLYEHPGSFVLKTPYSSSGRGLLWLDKNELNDKDKDWIKGAIKKQGSISIEPALNKWLDFALEFYLDKQGDIRYEGLSVFSTSKKGAYKENSLKSEKYLTDVIASAIDNDIFQSVKEKTAEALKEVYGAHYTGYLGVDMLIYKTSSNAFAIHPCIEINMRYTMGMVSIQLFRKYIHPQATGIFSIVYERKPALALQWHDSMKKAYPLRFEDGKLRYGYFSLCPVTANTHFIAYLVVR